MIKKFYSRALMEKRKFSNGARKAFYGALWYFYPFKQKKEKSKLIWITQYYNSQDQERQTEIDETLLINTKKPWIEKIILFTNAIPPIVAQEKIELIDVSERLHFGEILAYISKQQRDNENVYCITNSDIILTDDIVTTIPRLLQKQLIALTRWEFDNGLSHHFLPEITQDTWIVRDADFSGIAKSMDYIPLGILGCDNRFSRVMHDSGFTIWNPCLNVKTLHNHKSEKRTYTVNSRIKGGYMFPLECTKEEFFLKIKRRFILKSVT